MTHLLSHSLLFASLAPFISSLIISKIQRRLVYGLSLVLKRVFSRRITQTRERVVCYMYLCYLSVVSVIIAALALLSQWLSEASRSFRIWRAASACQPTRVYESTIRDLIQRARLEILPG